MARVNELSARYTVIKDQFFMPSEWRAQDKVNKQGSVESGDISQGACYELYNDALRICYEAYDKMIELGVAKEMARFILPVSMFTEVRWNIDMNNLTKFLRLREDAHAQKETRDVANAIHAIAEQLFPWTMEAYKRFKFKVEDTYEYEKCY
jgi:thymidylate synthase (FAD)